MKYYLSGSMRGHAQHNYPLFESATAELRAQGYDILSPHELHTQGTSRVKCMTDDVAAVLSCDGVFCLPGWELSPGANVEVSVAWAADLPVYALRWDTEEHVWLVCPLPNMSLSIPREVQWYQRIPLVGLCGFARSGKDTVADHMVRVHDWSRFAFADALRDMLYALNPSVVHDDGQIRLAELIDRIGWEVAKTKFQEVRGLLQRLGTEAGRDILGQNTWVRIGEEKIEQAIPRPVVVSDCRFPNEIAMVRRRGGTLVWVDRPGVHAVNGHASEHSVGPEDCAVILRNDSTLDDLHTKIDLFIINLGWDPAVSVSDLDFRSNSGEVHTVAA